ncbi:MAG: phosphotransferase, partial [Mycobacterium sp.]
MKPHLDTGQVVGRPGDLTAAWLTAAIRAGAVADFTIERIGTGQMSECYRVQLTYADGGPSINAPASVVLKVAATDPVSRQTGVGLGLYGREVRFYRDIAPRLHGPVAPCYHAAFDAAAGVFDVLLGDVNPAVVGDEIRGATAAQARLAVTELARLQAPLLGDTTLADSGWLHRDAPINQALITQLHAGFIDRYGGQITPPHRTVCERLVGGFDAYLAEEAADSRIHGLVHGDYRLDNMLFGATGADRPLTVVDWQTVTWGPAMTDLAYFLGCALPVADRRRHYDALLQAYHGALGLHAPISLADVREGVRRQSFFGVMMAIVSSMLVERTERGDAMFMTMLQRHCEHVLDIDALATLPVPTPVEPLCPSREDESAHPATDEPLWSESWYADFADAAMGLGGWIRIGLMPNQNTAWLHALLCGPDMPTVAVVDLEVPLPTDSWAVRTGTIDFTHSASDPLRTYRVGLRGRGQSYADPAALLRGEQGAPVEVAMDLVWTTDGTPYQYRLTPRYEIPCVVSGTVMVDGDRYPVDSVAGQRDHSWGVRDWWGMDWVWSALHLDDGTHLHAVDLRIPGAPAIGVGYVQG